MSTSIDDLLAKINRVRGRGGQAATPALLAGPKFGETSGFGVANNTPFGFPEQHELGYDTYDNGEYYPDPWAARPPSPSETTGETYPSSVASGRFGPDTFPPSSTPPSFRFQDLESDGHDGYTDHTTPTRAFPLLPQQFHHVERKVDLPPGVLGEYQESEQKEELVFPVPQNGQDDDVSRSKIRSDFKLHHSDIADHRHNSTVRSDAVPCDSLPRQPHASHNSDLYTQGGSDHAPRSMQKSRSKVKEEGSDDEYGDDSWMETAIAEVNEVEAKHLAPPGPSRSPFFEVKDESRLAPNIPAVSRLKPPSRQSTSSPAIRFPKSAPLRSVSREMQPTMPRGNPGDLVSVKALDSTKEQSLFSFEYFNAMQSAIFYAAYVPAGGPDTYLDAKPENLVVSAPTGSGKTTVFELAFLNMWKDPFNDRDNMPLAIYMAPTKALCYERATDWSRRLSQFGVVCLQITGDSSFADVSQLFHKNPPHLIVTTPEKWDSLTRKSSAGRVLLERLRLVMIDEVHILHEERGATLEVVVSRMKEHDRDQDRVRFVAVSASVPNIDDVARWIGSRKHANEPFNDIESMPKAAVYTFGEEFRPVPLVRKLRHFDATNDFALGSRLDKELFPILREYSGGKPILIFCPTRKACQTTAEHIYKEYEAAMHAHRPLPWDPSKNNKVVLKDSKLQGLTNLGIAVHHAGLELLDRRTIEDAFKASQLHCLVATSTLAVGVNLPAHLVVIKGTSMWEGQGFRDYTDIDIQQMMGRAGRPQYDTSGTVVLMCATNKKARFSDILNSRMQLESCLHNHLTEHINSEVGLRTITSLESGKKWLRSSFLWIRIQQNPRHYVGALVRDHSKSWDETLDRHVENALNDLEKNGFVECDDPPDMAETGPKLGLRPTQLGLIMSQSFISYRTMLHVITMSPNASVRDLLEILAGSVEFSSLRIRQGEAGPLNKLRNDPEIRFPLDENVKTYASDKVFLQLQIIFGNVSLDKVKAKTENASHLQTQVAIYNSAPRIAKAIVQVASENKYGGATRSALELLRTVNGKAWEDSAAIFRQIPSIGPKSITVLGTNGVTSFDDLLQMDPGRLEAWLGRNAPYGSQIINAAQEFPRFSLNFELVEITKSAEGYPVLDIAVTITPTGLLHRPAPKNGKGSSKPMAYNLTVLFLTSKDDRFLELRATNPKKLMEAAQRTFNITAELRYPGEQIVAIAGVDERAGLASTFQFDPRLDQSYFPDPEKQEAPTASAVEGQPSSPKTKMGKASVKEPLFTAKSQASSVSDYEDIDGEEEVIDLTGNGMKRPATSSSSSRKRSKRPKVSIYVDHEAEDEDEDVEDDAHSVDSLEAEFGQFFNDSPSPAPPVPTEKVKQKSTRTPSPAPIATVHARRGLERQRAGVAPPSPLTPLSSTNAPGRASPLASTIARLGPTWETSPGPQSRSSTLSSDRANPNDPIVMAPTMHQQSVFKPTRRPLARRASPTVVSTSEPMADPLAEQEIPTAPRAAGISYNPSTGSVRRRFFQRTPSAEKPPSTLFVPSAVFSMTPLDETLAPDVNSLRAMLPRPGRDISSSPIPLELAKQGNEENDTAPPSGDAEDFDTWVMGLLS